MLVLVAGTAGAILRIGLFFGPALVVLAIGALKPGASGPESRAVLAPAKAADRRG